MLNKRLFCFLNGISVEQLCTVFQNQIFFVFLFKVITFHELILYQFGNFIQVAIQFSGNGT